ncbi:phage tail tape measure protein, partial [Pararhodospirillum oryzae]|uniref:phage tail tape measure protein n=1 Tax=Pararhodospirillum oryzae TaxID=478448 RepID=UPI00147830F2
LMRAAVVWQGFRLGQSAVGAWTQYETALVGVGKVTDLAGQGLADLGEEIRGLALRPELGATTGELMAIAQAAGQLGVKTPDIAKFTTEIAKIQGATDLSGDDAATSFARILTLTHTVIDDVDRLGSSIVALGNNYAATEREITGVTLRLSQDLSLYNVSASAAAGLGAGLAALGITAERGGGALARAYAAIDAATRKSGSEQKALARITGQSAEEVKAAWGQDTTAVFARVLTGLQRIKASGGDVAAALGALGLTATEDVSTLGTLATGVDTVTSALDLSRQAWTENTAATKEAEAAGKTAESQLTVFSNRLEGLKTDLGEAVTPALL